jgi:hypothetical protein
VTRALAILSMLAVLGFGYLGLRQGTSFVLREDPGATTWTHGGTSHVGGWVYGRGYVTYGGRSEWAGFRGGGPGSGK